MAAKVDVVVSLFELDHWVPIRIYLQNSELMVDWCYLGERLFTDPFFSMTIQSQIENPFCATFRHQTPIAVLEERHKSHPGMKPTGFIFHMSHCGSTLIAQMLASLGNLVLSEADPLEMALRRSIVAPQIPEEQRADWIRWMISALGQPRSGAEKYYFIKFDTFPITQLHILERAFPNVPWIFIYRNPLEVLASITTMPGCAIRGYLDPALLGLKYESVMSMSDEEYLVRLLAKYCECALQGLAGGHGKLLNFNQLPEAVWTSLGAHFRVEFSAAEIARMQQRAGFNAKFGEEKFSSDSEKKRHAATPRLQALAAEWLDPLYLQLEAARQNTDQAGNVLGRTTY